MNAQYNIVYEIVNDIVEHTRTYVQCKINIFGGGSPGEGMRVQVPPEHSERKRLFVYPCFEYTRCYIRYRFIFLTPLLRVGGGGAFVLVNPRSVYRTRTTIRTRLVR